MPILIASVLLGIMFVTMAAGPRGPRDPYDPYAHTFAPDGGLTGSVPR